MKKVVDLVFIGAGTAFYEIYEFIRCINLKEEKYRLIAIVDDNVNTHGSVLNGVRVVGNLECVHNYPNAKFIFGIGSMKTRLIRNRIFNKLNLDINRFETIIHPTAIIDPSAKISAGCIIHPGACIGNDVVLEEFSIVAVNSAIGPFARIQSFAMITSLVAVLSNVNVGRAVFIGSCSCITENVSIGNGSMIGAGTVISRDLPEGVFFLGNPGRLISKIEIPEDL